MKKMDGKIKRKNGNDVIHPKKSLGQHFLKSQKAIAQIVAAARLTPGESVCEIGPGEGILTRALLAAGARVIAIEKDHRLIAPLRETFKKEIGEGQLTLVAGDVLDLIPGDYHSEPTTYKVVANIPYYITGAILKQFLSAARQPERMVLLLQKEVAARVVARDNKESVLSISVKAYGTPSIAGAVPRGAFSPAPNVDSAILVIADISRARLTTVDEKRFFALVRSGFAHKRKLVARNLALNEATLARCGIAPRARAEDLSVAEWECLTAATTIKD